MPKNDPFAKISPFLVKSRRVLSGHKGPIVLIDATQKLNSQRKLSSVNHDIFVLPQSSLWIKVSRGAGLIIAAKKFKGSKKIKVPSKRLLVIAKSDLKHFDNKYEAILTYTPSGDEVCTALFRFKKLDQLHIDTPSAKIMSVCRLDGQRYVDEDFAKTRKKIATINLSWVKSSSVDEIKCVWDKQFSELMILMGLISP